MAAAYWLAVDYVAARFSKRMVQSRTCPFPRPPPDLVLGQPVAPGCALQSGSSTQFDAPRSGKTPGDPLWPQSPGGLVEEPTRGEGWCIGPRTKKILRIAKTDLLKKHMTICSNEQYPPLLKKHVSEIKEECPKPPTLVFSA